MSVFHTKVLQQRAPRLLQAFQSPFPNLISILNPKASPPEEKHLVSPREALLYNHKKSHLIGSNKSPRCFEE